MLDIEKVTIPSKYTDYTDIFSLDSTAKLSKHTGINNHLINLIDDKQPFYSRIYSLRPVEFKILKIYIETILTNSFIRPFKSLVNAPILFIYKNDDSF